MDTKNLRLGSPSRQSHVAIIALLEIFALLFRLRLFHNDDYTCSGQQLRGAFVAERQIRGSLSARLRHSARGDQWAKKLLWIL